MSSNERRGGAGEPPKEALEAKKYDREAWEKMRQSDYSPFLTFQQAQKMGVPEAEIRAFVMRIAEVRAGEGDPEFVERFLNSTGFGAAEERRELLARAGEKKKELEALEKKAWEKREAPGEVVELDASASFAELAEKLAADEELQDIFQAELQKRFPDCADEVERFLGPDGAGKNVLEFFDFMGVDPEDIEIFLPIRFRRREDDK